MVGHMVAATLGPWVMESIASGVRSFSAKVRDVDEFWIERRPLSLHLDLGPEVMVWEGVDITVSGQRVSGVLKAEQRKRS